MIYPLVLALVGGVVGYGLFLREGASRTVTARAHVLIEPLVGNPLSSLEYDNTVALRSEAQVALSRPVLTRVASSGITDMTADQLRQVTRAQVIDNTQIVVVSSRAATAQEARAIVGEIAAGMLARRTAVAEEARKAQVSMLEARIETSREEFSVAWGKAGSSTVSILTSRLAYLNRQLRDLPASTTDPGSVIAQFAFETNGKMDGALHVASGAAVGFVLGGLLAWSVRRRRVAPSAPVGRGAHLVRH